MGAIVKQLKKGKASPYPMKPNGNMMELLQKAWSDGFDQGAKSQREKDIESTITLLEGLEDIPGIGEKTAWKIREHVMRQFGNPS